MEEILNNLRNIFNTVSEFIFFIAISDCCCLLIIVENSLYQDQGQGTVGSDLDLNHLTLIIFLKTTFEKVNFKNISVDGDSTINIKISQRIW